MMVVFFFPLLWLPARVFSAYCYLPFAGLGIAMAGIAEACPPAVVAAFFLLWAPLEIHSLRAQRNDTLRRADEAREWVTTLGRFAGSKPAIDGFVYDGTPEGFHVWGLEGTVKYYFRRFAVTIPPADSPEGVLLRQSCPTALLRWDGYHRKLEIHTDERAEPALSTR